MYPMVVFLILSPSHTKYTKSSPRIPIPLDFIAAI